MNRTRYKSLALILLCFFMTGILQAQEQHWQYNPYAFEYDMTAYVTLKVNNAIVSNPENYEIAAFCGTTCRGVAKLMTADDEAKYYYLRIRSKKASGEKIKFCVYNCANDAEIWAEKTVKFVSQSAVGYPSNPFVLQIVEYKNGDANGDGEVNISDVVEIVNYILGNPSENLNEMAADVNGDGNITTADAVGVVNIIMNE